MISPENRLFCRLDEMPGSEREQQRLQTLETLGLLQSESIPIFDEATQTAARFLDAPICILSIVDRDRTSIKSAVGLSRIGLMNELAASRQLPRDQSFCTYVQDSQHALGISDALTHPVFADSILVQHYGIRSYLGVPLVTSNGYCLGALAVMGWSPRDFTAKEVELLELTARWAMSEFERNRLVKQNSAPIASPDQLPIATPKFNHKTDASAACDGASVKLNLISQMTQELRTPLTSILGMASVLGQGIYGNLADKQKEYIEIIHNSGQYLLSLINEIVELGTFADGNQTLHLSPVDVEMLCQQAIATLSRAAQRREQHIQLTVEPGPRIWLLDKDKVRQLLYHLIFSVIHASSSDSTIRIHVSRRQNALNLTVWTSHPWLGDGLPQVEMPYEMVLEPLMNDEYSWSISTQEAQPLSTIALETRSAKPETDRQNLGLMLSRQLAEMHGGSIVIRGSVEEGYRYVVKLPQMQETEN